MPPRSPAGPSATGDRFIAVADRLVAPVILLSHAGEIRYVNPAVATLFHQERGWLVGRRFAEITHPADRVRLRQLLRTAAAGKPSGRNVVLRARAHPVLDWRVLECTADQIDDDEVRGLLLSVHDVTASRAENLALAEIAYRDPLTGLPNRARIVAELTERLRVDGALTLAMISIDRLSLAEDSIGRVGAEGLIDGVGRRLATALPAGALLGRLEGGSFAAILPASDALGASGMAWRILERVRGPMFVGAREFNPSVSIGMARRDLDATVESLFWDAGLALHRAEARGGGRVETFSNGLRREVVARLEIEADLRRAIADQSMSLAFQPIIRLADRSVTGSEALLRWHHPKGDLQPADFVPIAEEAGLIVPLGEWVTGEAARLAHDIPGQRVSINLSPRQLATPGLTRILDGLVTARTTRDAVQFEITETLLIAEWEYTAGVLAELRRLGYRVGLDDFGTGYSSLAYLRRLPLDFLKIDRSLVADVDGDRQARAVIGAVIQVAAALDLEVVAEGVEREGQAEALLALGADQAQGHLFGAAAELAAS